MIPYVDKSVDVQALYASSVKRQDLISIAYHFTLGTSFSLVLSILMPWLIYSIASPHEPERSINMSFKTNTTLHPTFDTDIRDLHLIYDYNAEDEHGASTKWRYEIWFFSESRVVYAIHGGPMAGRLNYQTCIWQCVRPGELWQCNWLEETGTICSLVYDITLQKITTLLGFSKGHWENADKANGDKRNPEDFERWRGLAGIGLQSDRFMLAEQATVLEVFRGKGDLVPIEPDARTL